jgi:hypothetical protein
MTVQHVHLHHLMCYLIHFIPLYLNTYLYFHIQSSFSVISIVNLHIIIHLSSKLKWEECNVTSVALSQIEIVTELF